jgi:hypothetical protein
MQIVIVTCIKTTNFLASCILIPILHHKQEKNIQCEYRGKISNFLNNGLQESLYLDLLMIQIIHFWILKMLLPYGEFPPIIIP